MSGEGGRGFTDCSLPKTWGPGYWAFAYLASFYPPVKKKKRKRKEWEKGAEGGMCGQNQEPSIWEAEGVLELKEG